MGVMWREYTADEVAGLLGGKTIASAVVALCDERRSQRSFEEIRLEFTDGTAILLRASYDAPAREGQIYALKL